MQKRDAVDSACHESIYPTMGGAGMAGFALARMHVKRIYEAVWISGIDKRLQSAAARLCDSIGYQGGMSASLRGVVVPERQCTTCGEESAWTKCRIWLYVGL